MENNKHEMDLKVIQISKIHADEEFNCRGKIVPIDVIDLAKDIAQNGLMQPVSVIAYDEAMQTKTGFTHKLIAGFRRRVAFIVNGEDEIPCVIKQITNELDALAYNLSENLQRKDLNILQEAKAIKRMRDLGITEQDAGTKIGMSRGWIQVRFMLLGLPIEVQEEAAIGSIKTEGIRELYTVMNQTGDVKLVLETAREMKEARAKGRSYKVKESKVKARGQKRHRTRGEIFSLLEETIDAVGTGLHTRALAWAAGQISLQDYYMSMKDHADENEIPWSIPQ